MGIVNVERLWAVTVESPMIENPELTLKILRYIACDHVPFPANLSLEDIQAQFPNDDAGHVTYSVVCAYQAKLLMGSQYKHTSFLDGTAEYTFGSIDGLSQAGGEYVRNAKTHFEDARELAEATGLEVTTETIRHMLTSLLKAAIAKVVSDGGGG